MSPEQIRARRMALGWSQSQLAVAAGTSQQTIDRLERGAVRHTRALPAVIAALSAGSPANTANTAVAAAAAVAAPFEGPAAPGGGLRLVYSAWLNHERLHLTAATEVLPPPPMLGSAADAYGISLETDLACFQRGDVLWFNPALRPRYGGPGILYEVGSAPGAGTRVRLDFSCPSQTNRIDVAHRLVAAYFRS